MPVAAVAAVAAAAAAAACPAQTGAQFYGAAAPGGTSATSVAEKKEPIRRSAAKRERDQRPAQLRGRALCNNPHTHARLRAARTLRRSVSDSADGWMWPMGGCGAGDTKLWRLSPKQGEAVAHADELNAAHASRPRLPRPPVRESIPTCGPRSSTPPAAGCARPTKAHPSPAAQGCRRPSLELPPDLLAWQCAAAALTLRAVSAPAQRFITEKAFLSPLQAELYRVWVRTRC